MGKETTSEKYIKKAVEAAAKKLAGNSIHGCNFVGVQFDAKATEAIVMVASAIKENATACVKNAKALQHLAHVLNATGVKIETMVKIN